MKNKKIALAIMLAFVFVLTAFTSFASPMDRVRTADNPKIIKKNDINKFDGFDYELWRDKGEGFMSLTGGGTFECAWDRKETGNILFRMGKKFDRSKTHEEIGQITLDYAAEFEIIAGDVSYLCMYGWTVNPLVEFYVVENFGGYRPPGGKGFQDTIEVDGVKYDVYLDTRVNQPSILGTQTFPQFFSVRRPDDRTTEGVIDVSEHFRLWEESSGLEMGKLSEVAFCVEGFNSSGYANVYRNILTVGDNVYGEPYSSWLQYPSGGPDDEPADDPEPEEDHEPEPDPADEPSEATPPTAEDINEDDNNSFIFVMLGIGGVIILCAIIAIIAKSKAR